MEAKEVLTIDNIKPENLPELQGYKEKQLAIVTDNPFTEITDNSTYELAKKHRTALKTARTDLEKQDKLIASKLTDLRKKVGTITAELIDITKPHEVKQQAEVDVWESKKEAEKQEKIRLENERIEKLKSEIESIYQAEKTKIDNLEFSKIEDLKNDFENNLLKIDATQFSEFEIDFNEKINLINELLNEKIGVLTEKENQRLEFKRLETERENQRLEAEKLAKEKAEFEEQKRREQAEIDKINAEKQAEINKQLAEIEAEKKRVEEIEAEKLAKENAEIEAKRLEELKPDKEKAIAYLNSFNFSFEMPKFNDKQISNELEHWLLSIESKISEAKEFINKIK